MTAPTPAPSAADAKPTPKPPGGIIRWGVLAFLVVATLLFAFVGAGPLTKWAIESYGPTALNAPVTVESASLNVFGMGLTLKNLSVIDPSDPEKKKAQYYAEEIHGKIDPVASLRGQLVFSKLSVTNPKGRLTRNADGSINGTQTEEPPPGTSPDDPTWRRKAEEAAKERDLIEDVKSLSEKLKKWYDERVAEEQKAEERRKTQGISSEDDFEGRAAYIRGNRPWVVIRQIEAKGLTLDVEDKAAGASPQTITDATLEGREWSEEPWNHDQPLSLKLEGKLAGAPESAVKIEGSLDLRGEDTVSRLTAILSGLPLEKLDAYYKDSLPLALVGKSVGSVTLDPLEFKGWNIDWKPAILLDQIDARPRDPNAKIAGFDAARVAQELTNAGKILLKDIRIHGPIWNPSVEGSTETVKALVLEGGTAYAKKTLTAEAGKLLDKNPEAKKAVEALDKTGVGEVLQGAGEKPVEDTAKDALEKGLDIFGKKKKKDQK